MKRTLIIVIYTFLFSNVFAQHPALNKELFQGIQEPSIYKYYSGRFLVMFWVYQDIQTKGVDIDTSYFGFYESCDLPSLDSLKQGGAYYFEVDSSDFADEEARKINGTQNCAQLSVFTEGKDTLMNIYYSRRQQYATYKKVNRLPKNVEDYLKKKGVVLPTGN